MPNSFWKKIWEFGQKGTPGVLWSIPKCVGLEERGWGADVLQHQQDNDCPPGNTNPFVCIGEQESSWSPSATSHLQPLESVVLRRADFVPNVRGVPWDTRGGIHIQLCHSEAVQVQL